MRVISGYSAAEQTDDRIIKEKSFGENGTGHIRHIFPIRSDTEERQRAYDKVFEILYDAARRKESEQKAK